MNRTEDEFEEYLRNFGGDDLPAHLFERSFDRARTRRRHRIVLGVCSAFAAAAIIAVIALPLRNTGRPPYQPKPEPSEVTHQARTEETTLAPLSAMALTIAYRKCDLEGLDRRLLEWNEQWALTRFQVENVPKL